jgi:hypothetical protein
LIAASFFGTDTDFAKIATKTNPIRTLLLLLLATVGILHAADPASPTPTPAGGEYAEAVEKLVAMPPPASGGILMVGSSIFRKWTTCVEDLAPLPVTNRAFGGSKTADQVFFFDKIVPSSGAALVVWYCGSNDINGKKPPETILQNTKQWIERTQAALPEARILIVSVINAPQKRDDGQSPAVEAVNKGLTELAASFPNIAYVDVNPALQSADGQPAADCYLPDKLHLTPEAYHRMALVLRPLIEKEWKASPAAKPAAP